MILPVNANMGGWQTGAQVAYTGSSARFTLGGLYNFLNDRTTKLYGDVTAGITLNSLALDAEVSYNKKSADAGATLGYLVQVLYTVNDQWSFGARGEIVAAATGSSVQALRETRQQSIPYSGLSPIGTTDQTQTLIFVGPQYNIASNVKLKADYSFQSVVATTGAAARAEHGINLGVNYRF